MGPRAAHQVLAYGELLWDLLPSGPVLGGAPANFACRMHALGLPVALVTRVGRDELGARAVDMVARQGINTSLIQWDERYPTGTVDVTLNQAGDPTFVINESVAYDQVKLETALLNKAREVTLLYYGSLVQRALTARATLYRLIEAVPRAIKLFDVNLRANCYSAEILRQSLQFADIVKLNENEASELCRQLGFACKDIVTFAETLISRFDFEVCLITLGECGVYARNRRGQAVYQPGYQVQVADLIGAGDAFTAGFASRYIDGDSLEQCCEFGNRMGALAATKCGGMAPIEVRELEEFAACRAGLCQCEFASIRL